MAGRGQNSLLEDRSELCRYSPANKLGLGHGSTTPGVRGRTPEVGGRYGWRDPLHPASATPYPGAVALHTSTCQSGVQLCEEQDVWELGAPLAQKSNIGGRTSPQINHVPVFLKGLKAGGWAGPLSHLCSEETRAGGEEAGSEGVSAQMQRWGREEEDR